MPLTIVYGFSPVAVRSGACGLPSPPQRPVASQPGALTDCTPALSQSHVRLHSQTLTLLLVAHSLRHRLLPAAGASYARRIGSLSSQAYLTIHRRRDRRAAHPRSLSGIESTPWDTTPRGTPPKGTAPTHQPCAVHPPHMHMQWQAATSVTWASPRHAAPCSAAYSQRRWAVSRLLAWLDGALSCSLSLWPLLPSLPSPR